MLSGTISPGKSWQAMTNNEEYKAMAKYVLLFVPFGRSAFLLPSSNTLICHPIIHTYLSNRRHVRDCNEEQTSALTNVVRAGNVVLETTMKSEFADNQEDRDAKHQELLDRDRNQEETLRKHDEKLDSLVVSTKKNEEAMATMQSTMQTLLAAASPGLTRRLEYDDIAAADDKPSTRPTHEVSLPDDASSSLSTLSSRQVDCDAKAAAKETAAPKRAKSSHGTPAMPRKRRAKTSTAKSTKKSKLAEEKHYRMKDKRREQDKLDRSHQMGSQSPYVDPFKFN